jgi:hypothetical protein
MMTTFLRLGLLTVACVILPSCGGGSDDAAEAVDTDRGNGAGSADGSSGTTEGGGGDAPEPNSLLEFTGPVTSTGTEGMRMVNLRADDGSSVGLVGDLATELARLSGAVVTVRGNEAPAPADRGLDVTEYEVVSVNGETPSVGVLERRGGVYWLGSDPGVRLMGVPEALTQAVGAKVWVTGSSGADGVTVQSYGIIRPN